MAARPSNIYHYTIPDVPAFDSGNAGLNERSDPYHTHLGTISLWTIQRREDDRGKRRKYMDLKIRRSFSRREGHAFSR